MASHHRAHALAATVAVISNEEDVCMLNDIRLQEFVSSELTNLLVGTDVLEEWKSFVL